MSFPTAFARALAPIAIVAAASPAIAADAQDLARVQAHLAAVQSMTADFSQTDARGRTARGTLQLKKPGRIRFQYDGGDLLLVANGRNLTLVDYQVGQKSSWALDKTPLRMLLASRPDIKGSARVMPGNDPRVIVVRAKDRQYPETGTLILAFIREPSAPSGLKLYGWTAVDAQNKRTTVKLTNQRYNVAVAETAFRYAEPKRRGKK